MLVKRLVCIEDLGDIDILITDKTGTLTEGRISLVDAVDPAGAHSDSVLRLGLLATDVDPAVGRGQRATRWTPRCGNPPMPSDLVAAGVHTRRQRCRSTTPAARRRRWSTTTATRGAGASRVHPSRCWPDATMYPGADAAHPGRAVRRRAPGGRGGRQAGAGADRHHRRRRVRV